MGYSPQQIGLVLVGRDEAGADDHADAAQADQQAAAAALAQVQGRLLRRREHSAARDRVTLAEHALKTATGQADQTAERVKCSIGNAYPLEQQMTMEVKGRDLVSGIPKSVRIHSAEIRDAVQEPIQQIVGAVRRALEITPPELASDIVDRGIVMTGGGALIRGLDILLAQETGLPIHVDDDPLTCVVRGTGRILDDYEKYKSVLSA